MHSDRKIPVLFEDNLVIVFDKPAGLLVIPTPHKETNTLSTIANIQYAPADKSYSLHPCHRLDRDTSGAIIFAKGKKNQQIMMNLFERRLMKKMYIAYVHGRLRMFRGELRGAIADFDQRKFTKNPFAKQAITRYKVIELRQDFSIVEVYPLTGRTNQIRIQFSQIGHPLVGDRKYAFAKDFQLKFKRAALHASELEWKHPVNARLIKIKAPLPADMKKFSDEN